MGASGNAAQGAEHLSEAARALSDQHRLFCQEYLLDLSPQKAYQRAYPKAKARSASVAGAKLLKRDDVRAYIMELMDRRARRLDVDADRVILELARVGFSDMRRLMSWHEGSVNWHNSDELEDDAAASVAEVSETIRVNEHEDDDGNVDRVITTTRRMKLHPKITALQKLADHVGVGQGNGQQELPDVHVHLEMAQAEQEKELAALWAETEDYREEHEEVEDADIVEGQEVDRPREIEPARAPMETIKERVRKMHEGGA